jgi:3-hydroxyacyl-[acyl-carrier-protein] dehydratase
LRFAPDFLGFSGHFPGQPIVPAVAQIMAGTQAAAVLAGGPVELVGVENAKFVTPLGPDVEVTLTCRRRAFPAGERLDVKIASGAGPVSSFLLHVRSAGAPT